MVEADGFNQYELFTDTLKSRLIILSFPLKTKTIPNLCLRKRMPKFWPMGQIVVLYINPKNCS